MVSRNNRARLERNQNMLEAGFVSAHFPGVASIVISMMYNQRGIAKWCPGSLISFPAVMLFSG